MILELVYNGVMMKRDGSTRKVDVFHPMTGDRLVRLLVLQATGAPLIRAQFNDHPSSAIHFIHIVSD